MKTSQKGFTLIELVVVIVLLGILGVTALGKFQDLSGEARQAAADGIASEMSAAAAINFAVSQVPGATPDFTIGAAGTDIIADGAGAGDGCDSGDLGELFQSGTAPTTVTYAEVGSPDCGAGPGTTYQCTLTDTTDGSVTATATLVCTQ